MANDVEDVEETPDAWVGVSPEYQNYSEVTGKPFAVPGEYEEHFNPTPDVVAVTINPDGTPAGVYAVQLAAQEKEAEAKAEIEGDGESVAADAPADEPVKTVEAPAMVVSPPPPVE
jgi:hypothetical protein